MQADIFNVIRYHEGLDAAAGDDARRVLTFFDDQVKSLMPASILPWVQSNVYPPGSERPVTLDGYQVEPLTAQVEKEVDEVVITGPEQFGKSLTYQAAMIYKLVFTGGPKMIVYEEKNKAYKINTRQFIPMVEKVDALARQLEASGNKAIRETVQFATCFLDFYGAGADLTSNNYRDGAADEYDTYPLTFAKKRAQLENMSDNERHLERENDKLIDRIADLEAQVERMELDQSGYDRAVEGYKKREYELEAQNEQPKLIEQVDWNDDCILEKMWRKQCDIIDRLNDPTNLQKV